MVYRVGSVATSILLIAISGATATYSVALARFEASGFGHRYASAEVAAAFANFAGLRGPARIALAKGEGLPEDTSLEDIEKVLEVEPSNGVFWLRLAEKQYQGFGDAERLASLSALHISEVVQPREAKTMVIRTVFILRHWEDLPPSDRLLAIAHLVELNENLSDDDREVIAQTLTGKLETSRKEIEQAILDRAGGDKKGFSWLGL